MADGCIVNTGRPGQTPPEEEPELDSRYEGKHQEGAIGCDVVR